MNNSGATSLSIDAEPRAGAQALGEDLKELFRGQLDLSKLRPEETLAICYTSDSRPEYVIAARLAAADIGARVVELPIPSTLTIRREAIAINVGGTATLDEDSVAAIKGADMLLDVTADGLLWSPGLDDIRGDGGVRTVMAVDPPEVLQRMFPSPELKDRVKRNEKRLQAGTTMRAVSDAGTDFSCELGQYTAGGRYGYSDEPGHWDHWPAGFVATYPTEGTANGVIVLSEGDVPLPWMRYVRAPVRMEFADGLLTTVEGGLDARLIREFIESHDDPEAYFFSHIGWGLQRKASWAAIPYYAGERMFCQDIRVFEGNFLFSTGPNPYADRHTSCHFDFACRDVDVYVDDELIVERGVVIPDYLQ